MKRTTIWMLILAVFTAVMLANGTAAAEYTKTLEPRIMPLAEDPQPRRGGARISGPGLNEADGATTCEPYTYTVSNGNDQGVVWYEYKIAILDDPRDGKPANTMYVSDRTKSNAFTYTFYRKGTYVLFVYRYDKDGAIVLNETIQNVQHRIYITGDSEDNPLTREVEIAAEICKAEGDEFATAVAINDYLADRVTYDYSFTHYSPEAALLWGRGVCNSYSYAYEMIATACGLNCRRVYGTAGGDHAWNAVEINGKWYQTDPTWNDGSSIYSRHIYMGLNDELMGADHFNFDYPYAEGGVTCDSLEDNYYIHTGKWHDIAETGAKYGETSVMDRVQTALNGLSGSSGTITADFGNKAWLEGGNSYVSTSAKRKILGNIAAYGLSRETLLRKAGSSETPMQGTFTYNHYSNGGTLTGNMAESGLTISGLKATYDTGESLDAEVTFDTTKYDGDKTGLKLEIYAFYEEDENNHVESCLTEYDQNGLSMNIDSWKMWDNGNMILEAAVQDENGAVVTRARKAFTIEASHSDWGIGEPNIPVWFEAGDNTIKLFTDAEAAAHASGWMDAILTVRNNQDGAGAEEQVYALEQCPLNQEISFSAQAGETVNISATVKQDRYPALRYNLFEIPVFAQTSMSDSTHPISVSINPAGDTLPICQPITITVNAENAEWIRIEDSNGMYYEPIGGETAVYTTEPYEDTDVYFVWATAGYADGSEYKSVPQTVKMTRRGKIGRIELNATFSDPQGRSIAERGELIPVSFEPVNPYIGTGVDEGTEVSYQLSIFSMDGEPAQIQWDWVDEANHQLVVRTAGMHEGAYRMSGTISAAGYTPYCTDDEGVIQFVIKEPSNTAPRTVCLTTDKETGTTEEDIGISAYAKDAAKIQIFFNPDDEAEKAEAPQAYLNTKHSYPHSGAYWLKARAFFKEDPGNNATQTEEMEWDPVNGGLIRVTYWRLDSEEKPVTISAEDGKELALTDNMVTMPEILTRGEDLTVTVKWPENATYLSVHGESYPNAYNAVGNQRYERSEHPGESVTFIMEADLLDNVQTGGGVTIRVTAGAAGYEAADWERSIPVEGCTHSNYDFVFDWVGTPTYTPIEGDDHYHRASGTMGEIKRCRDCGEDLEQTPGTTYSYEIMEGHEYNENGVCVKCQHVNQCTHAHKQTIRWVYADEEEEIHRFDEEGYEATALAHMVTGNGFTYEECDDCGIEMNRTDLTEKITVGKPHSYENGVCTECGYTCLHPAEAQRAEMETDHYLYATKDRQYHYNVPVYRVTHYCEMCGYRDPSEEPSYEKGMWDMTDPHTDGTEETEADGFCDKCGASMSQDWEWEIANGNTLVISGSGTVEGFANTDALPWFAAADMENVDRVIVENGITGLGANVLAGFADGIRIDFYTMGQPQVSEATFGGCKAVCRYYDDTTVWDETKGGEDVKWVYLPVKESGDSFALAYYREENADGPTWHVRENIGVSSANDTAVDREAAIEYSQHHIAVILDEIPTAVSGDREVYENRNVSTMIIFNNGCTGPYTLDYSEYPDIFVQMDISAPGLELTIEGPDGETEPLFSMDVHEAKSINCKWDIADLRLRNTRADCVTKVQVDGDVETLSFYDATSDQPYRGTLAVSGEVEYGTIYGRNELAVPGVTQNGNPVRFGSIDTASFTYRHTETEQEDYVIEFTDGESRLNPAIDRQTIGELTLDMFELTYQYWGTDRVSFGVSPKEGSGLGIQGGYVENILEEEYNPEFTTANIIWGEDTTVYFMDTGDTPYELNGGTENGQKTGIGALYVENCNVTINCPVGFLKTWQYRNDLGPVNLTINDRVDRAEVMFFRSGGSIRLGDNGAILEGTWDRGIRGYRSIGCEYGPCDYAVNGTLRVLSAGSTYGIKAAPAGDAEVTDAAGTGAGTVASMDVNNSSIGDDEADAVAAYLANNGLTEENIVSVFDVSVTEYTADETGNALNEIGPIPELNRGVLIAVENTSGESVSVVRLHKNNQGEMTAERLTGSVAGSRIQFTSDRFSTYLLVTGATELNPDQLTKLVLPAGLRRIEDNAFEGIAAQAVIIPEGCEYIGSKAFRNCPNLIYVEYYAGTDVAADAFAECNSLEQKIK